MPANVQECEYLLHLLRCAAHDETPRSLPEGVTWGKIVSLSLQHSLACMTFLGAQPLVDTMRPDLAQKWEQRNKRALSRYINQEQELETLTAAFSAAGVVNMPIKGARFRRLFPHPEAREMTDLDILIHPDSFETADKLMRQMGYQCEHGATHHTVYCKRPHVIVELHHSLLPDYYSLGGYFNDCWKRALPTEHPNCFELSPEDEYIYMLAHAAKHYHRRGMGIRYIFDVYCYRMAFAGKLNEEYISEEIKKAGLTSFADAMEELAEAWFGENAEAYTHTHTRALSEDAKQMAYYVCNGSTFGDSDNIESNAVRDYMSEGKSLKEARRTYLLSLIYPPLTAMREIYPVLNKAPVLLPVCWVARHLRLLFRKPKQILEKYHSVKEIKPYDSTSEQ